MPQKDEELEQLIEKYATSPTSPAVGRAGGPVKPPNETGGPYELSPSPIEDLAGRFGLKFNVNKGTGLAAGIGAGAYQGQQIGGMFPHPLARPVGAALGGTVGGLSTLGNPGGARANAAATLAESLLMNRIPGGGMAAKGAKAFLQRIIPNAIAGGAVTGGAAASEAGAEKLIGVEGASSPIKEGLLNSLGGFAGRISSIAHPFPFFRNVDDYAKAGALKETERLSDIIETQVGKSVGLSSKPFNPVTFQKRTDFAAKLFDQKFAELQRAHPLQQAYATWGHLQRDVFGSKMLKSVDKGIAKLPTKTGELLKGSDVAKQLLEHELPKLKKFDQTVWKPVEDLALLIKASDPSAVEHTGKYLVRAFEWLEAHAMFRFAARGIGTIAGLGAGAGIGSLAGPAAGAAGAVVLVPVATMLALVHNPTTSRLAFLAAKGHPEAGSLLMRAAMEYTDKLGGNPFQAKDGTVILPDVGMDPTAVASNLGGAKGQGKASLEQIFPVSRQPEVAEEDQGMGLPGPPRPPSFLGGMP